MNVYVWGRNNEGQCGTDVDIIEPAQLLDLGDQNPVDIGCGKFMLKLN